MTDSTLSPRNERPSLKQSTGWFAAGDGFHQALTLLSDGAFNLFAYICVKADRQTACFQATQKDLAIVLGKSRRILGRYVSELSEKKVCRVHMGTNQFTRTTFEICDAYWPYQKPSRTSVSTEAGGYVPSICKYFVSLGCGTGRFGSSDVRAAEKFRERGIPLAVVEDAMLVGACRKFVSWLNGKLDEPIGSLYYFAPLVEEIRQKPISDSYRSYLRSQLIQLSRRWLNRVKAAQQNKGSSHS